MDLRRFLALALMLAAPLQACSSDLNPVTGPALSSLSGNGPAIKALPRLFAPAPPAAVETGIDGIEYSRTYLQATLSPSASIEALNTALHEINGKLAFSEPGNAAIAIELPDPGSLDALGNIIARLETSPALEKVSRTQWSDTPN